MQLSVRQAAGNHVEAFNRRSFFRRKDEQLLKPTLSARFERRE
ncbi:hypothetical protein [Sphingorhabdus sp.]|jgi:hypothetical protein